MSKQPRIALVSRHETSEHSMQPYILGFVLSLLCTLVPFALVTGKMIPGKMQAVALLVFACLQFVVQTVFFLHLGRETKPRWKLVALIFALFTAVVVVAGSLWIMYSLNYRMMPEQDVEQQVMQEEGIFRQ